MLFVRLFGLCLFGFVGFLFPLGLLKGLRFVIVALPGLFSYVCLEQAHFYSILRFPVFQNRIPFIFERMFLILIQELHCSKS